MVCLIEEGTQTDITADVFSVGDNLDQLTMESLPSSVPGLRRLVTSLNFEKKEISTRLLFATQKNESLQGKVQAFEQKIKVERENNQKLADRVSDLDFKVERKHQKIRRLKEENKDLISRLEHYVDKDQMQRVLILNKAEDFEKTAMKLSEKEKNHCLEIMSKNEEISKLKEKIELLEQRIAKLEQEKSQLGDLLSLEQERNQDLIQKTEAFLSSENLTSPPVTGRSRRPSFMQQNSENLKKSMKSGEDIKKPSFIGTSEVMKKFKANDEMNKTPSASQNKNLPTFKQVIDTPKITLRPEETPRITISNEISPKLKGNSMWNQEGGSPRLRTSPKQKEIYTPREKSNNMISFRDCEPILNEYMEKIQNLKNSENFERNWNFFVENCGVDLVEEKKELKKKVEEYEKKIEEGLGEKEKLIDKINAFERRSEKTPVKNKLENLQQKVTRNSVILKRKSVAGDSKRPSVTPEKQKTFMEKQSEKFHKTLESSEKTRNTSKEKSVPKTRASHLRVRTEESPFFEKMLPKVIPEKKNNTQTSRIFTEKLTKTPKVRKIGTPPEDFDENYYNSLITEIETKDRDAGGNEGNFSKKKFLYKYPFKQIEAYLHLDKNQCSKTEKSQNEEFFQRVFKDLCQKHQGCGKNCDHLSRFYNKIGFISKFRNKERLLEQRTVIDKLPLDFYES